jgi:O-antigen/teichoic acid export membrane protein
MLAPSIVAWVLLSNGCWWLWRFSSSCPWPGEFCPPSASSLSLIRSSGQIRELMAFGGLNFLGGIGYLLYYASDSIIISNLQELGPDQIVYYNVAQRWDPQIRMLVMAFVGTMLPLMTSMVSLRQTDRLHSVFLRGTRYSLLIGPCPPCLPWFGRAFPSPLGGCGLRARERSVMQLLMVQFLLCLARTHGVQRQHRIRPHGRAPSPWRWREGF